LAYEDEYPPYCFVGTASTTNPSVRAKRTEPKRPIGFIWPKQSKPAARKKGRK
jgi:hypothetical protein